MIDQLRATFQQHFGAAPDAFTIAPARVELLGNHTDYNGGLVMSAAIDRFTVVAGRAVQNAGAEVFSLHFNERAAIAEAGGPAETPTWARYLKGVSDVLGRAGHAVNALQAAVAGDIPVGAGLSSSASLEAAWAFLLLSLAGHDTALDDDARMSLARLLQRAENEEVGVACGLLDQFSVLLGREGWALWLDCDTRQFGRVPLGAEPPAIVVCDTKTSRRLADGMYNKRRDECETVVAYFQALRGPDRVRWLRDVRLDELDEHWERLDPVGRRRARHVLSENARVEQGIAKLKAGDLAAFGALMSRSHASSRDNFENSSPALDALVESAEAAPGFLGGKLSGAGWAGCTVSLVRPDQTEAFAEAVRARYSARLGMVPEVHVCRAADGARRVDLSGE